ncbi:unnamed protein product [Soboliphyme baturini]|uniref:MFS domain-containing protein n=1 Tax=Soboliphyme baturini TaxID=241478 RepID=A0A183I9P1_9BILA|nr:unnamed protein product [Soboliphyme baturini]
MLLNNIIALFAACLMGFCKIANSYWLLIFGRLVIGINCGLNSALCPMYLTEISPINMRGMLGSVNQLVSAIAILVAQVLSMNQVLGNEHIWPIALAFTAVPAIFQLILLPFCPESPKYLLATKNQPEKARLGMLYSTHVNYPGV